MQKGGDRGSVNAIHFLVGDTHLGWGLLSEELVAQLQRRKQVSVSECHIQIAFTRLLRLLHLHTLSSLCHFSTCGQAPTSQLVGRRLRRVEEGQRRSRLRCGMRHGSL